MLKHNYFKMYIIVLTIRKKGVNEGCIFALPGVLNPVKCIKK